MFMLPNLDDLPIPLPRLEREEDFEPKELEYGGHPTERSHHVESYYTFVFEDSPLFEQDEEEEGELDPGLIGLM